MLPAIGEPATLKDKVSGDIDANPADGPPLATKSVKPQPYIPAAVPPGISSAKDFPPLAAPAAAASGSAPKVQRKATAANISSPIIKPVVPVLSSQPPRALPAHKEATENQTPAQKDEHIKVTNSAQSDKPVSEPTQKGKPKGKTSTAELQIQPRPSKTRSKGAASNDVPAVKGVSGTQPALGQNAPGTASRQQLPGKLDISAANEASKVDVNGIAITALGQNKSKEASSTVGPDESRPTTPATSAAPASHASGSSVTRQPQNRTLRVVPTPAAEPPPRVPSASPSRGKLPPPAAAAVPAPSAAKRQPSRRGSFASVQVPGTPMSERISDNASFTSASISRANTPPPMKIGSAPVRQLSKSQQKKERQARAKLNEEASKAQDVHVPAIAEQPEQAPIIGRKKKTKKTATSGTADSTPTATRPSSPTPKAGGGVSQRSGPTTATPALPPASETSNAQSDNRVEGEIPTSPGISSGADQQSKNSLTAAAILSKLQKSGDISPTVLNIFKGVAGANYRFELGQADFAESETGPILSAAQARQINEGEAITFECPPNKRIIILPDRRLLRGLSADQAQRYLELRKRILSTPEVTAFHPPRHSIDRYLHAVPHQRSRSAKAASAPGSDGSVGLESRFLSGGLESHFVSGGLENRFVSPPLTHQTSTSTMPAYWSASPLSEDGGVVRRSSVLGVNEAEKAMLASRKETDALDKKLNALLKRNRKLVFGNSH